VVLALKWILGILRRHGLPSKECATTVEFPSMCLEVVSFISATESSSLAAGVEPAISKPSKALTAPRKS